MVPVSVFITDLGNDVLEGLVGSFCLSISLWVIGCGLDVLNLVLFVKNLVKLVDEFRSSISGNLLWSLESVDDFSMKEIGD